MKSTCRKLQVLSIYLTSYIRLNIALNSYLAQCLVEYRRKLPISQQNEIKVHPIKLQLCNFIGCIISNFNSLKFPFLKLVISFILNFLYSLKISQMYLKFYKYFLPLMSFLIQNNYPKNIFLMLQDYLSIQ